MERAQQQRNADRVPIAQVTSDTGSDPVRLYLKEIGQVELLDVNHEFWLATQLEAPKFIDQTCKQNPIAQRGNAAETEAYRALYSDLTKHWKAILEDTKEMKQNPPDFLKILEEARRCCSPAG